MSTIDTSGYTLLNPDKANEYVEVLNNNPVDDWTYEAVHCPNGTGQSFIVVYDEEGNKLGKL